MPVETKRIHELDERTVPSGNFSFAIDEAGQVEADRITIANFLGNIQDDVSINGNLAVAGGDVTLDIPTAVSGYVLTSIDSSGKARWKPAGAATDHGTLTGLGDDDHTQYLLIDGSRLMTGDLGFETDGTVSASGVLTISSINSDVVVGSTSTEHMRISPAAWTVRDGSKIWQRLQSGSMDLGDWATDDTIYMQFVPTNVRVYRDISGTDYDIANFGIGATIFNEDGIDQDFRVEGLNNPNLLTIDAGLDAIGFGANAQSNRLIEIYKSDTSTSNYYGTVSTTLFNPASTGSYEKYGHYVIAQTQGSNNNAGRVVGIRSDAVVAGAGDWTSVYGVQARAYANPSAGDITAQRVFYAEYWGNESATSVVTSAAALFINTPKNTNTITNMYGMYFAGLDASNVTNKYGIYLANITGTTESYAILTNAGRITFNEGGDVDSDLRVEGGTDQYLIYTDAGNDRVGIGASSIPSAKLHVKSDTETTVLNVDGELATGDASVRTGAYIGMDVEGGNQTGIFYGLQSLPRLMSTGTGSHFIAGKFRVDNYSSNALGIAKGIDIGNPFGAGDINDNYGIYIENMTRGNVNNYAIYTRAGDILFNAGGDPYTDFTVLGSGGNNLILSESDIQRVTIGRATNVSDSWITIEPGGTNIWADAGGTDYSVAGFAPTSVRLGRNIVNGDEYLTISNVDGLRVLHYNGAGSDNLLQIRSTSTIFNETGLDADFRIESTGNENIFYVDAGDDRIGIGTASPAYDLDIRENGWVEANSASNPFFRARYDAATDTLTKLQSTNGAGHIGTESDHSLNLVTNNSSRMVIQNTGAVTINEAGLDVDFRVEGNTDASLIRTDAGNNRVGIGTATPISKLDINGLGQQQYQLRVTTNKNPGDGTTLYGIITNPAVASGNQTGAIYGISSTPQINTVANATTIYGLHARVDNVSTGTITNARTIQADNPSGGGDITIATGLYVGSINAGGTNYAIFTNAGEVSLGDNLDFRTDSIISSQGSLTLQPTSAFQIDTPSAVSGYVLTAIDSDGTAVWREVPGSGTDHGNLVGLGDDDHPQYLLVDGSRSMTGENPLDFSTNGIITTTVGDLTLQPADNVVDIVPQINSTRYLRLTHASGFQFSIWSDGVAGDAHIVFDDDGDMIFYRGNIAGADERLRIGLTEAVFNNGGEDVNFRIEGNSDVNAFHIDAGEDSVGIGVVGQSDTRLNLYKSDVTTSTYTGATLESYFTPSSLASANKYGLYVIAQGQGDFGITGALIGVRSDVNVSALGQYPNSYAFMGRSFLSADGTISNLRLFYSDYWGNTSTSGVVTNIYGLSFAAPTSTSATAISNAYLVETPSISAGNFSNIYGVYIRGISAATTTARGLVIEDITGAAGNFAIVTNAGNIVFNSAGDSSTSFRVEGGSDENLLVTDPSTDRVGVGIVNPEGKVHIFEGSISAVTPNVGADGLIIEGNNTGMSFVTNNNSIANIFAAYPAAGNAFHGIQFFGPAHSTTPSGWGLTVGNVTRAKLYPSELEFQQAQTISTTAGDIVLKSADANIIIRPEPYEAAEFGSTAIVFNDGGNDIDFRVEGGSVTSLLHLNAGTDNVGIGGDPGALSTTRFYVFDSHTGAGNRTSAYTISRVYNAVAGSTHVAEKFEKGFYADTASGFATKVVALQSQNITNATSPYTATITDLHGIEVATPSFGGTGSWDIDDLAGISIQAHTAPAGTTDLMGLEIGDMTGATNNYAIRTYRGDVRFNENNTTNHKFTIEGSAGVTQLFVVDASINAIAVNASPTTTNQFDIYKVQTETPSWNNLRVYTAYYPATSGNATHHSIDSTMLTGGSKPDINVQSTIRATALHQADPDGWGTLAAYNARAYSTGTTGDLTTLAAFATSLFSNQGTGAVTNAKGLSIGGYGSTGGTTTNFYGIQIADQNDSNVTNKYGIEINDIINGITDNYAILTRAGNIVFNEDSDNNMTFRVEGATDQYLLFSDGPNNRVGIGASVPGGKLEVTSATEQYKLRVTGQKATGDANAIYGTWTTPSVAGGTQTGNIYGIWSQPSAAGTATTGTIWAGFFEAANSSSNTLTNAGGIQIDTPGGAGTITNSWGIYIQTQNRATTLAQGIYISDVTGATTSEALVTNAGNVVFNEGGDADTDFRIESDNLPNMFFLDAGLDRIGINTNTPSAMIEVLENEVTSDDWLLLTPSAGTSYFKVRQVVSGDTWPRVQIADQGGTEQIRLDPHASWDSFINSPMVFNDNGQDYDFRVEGSTKPWLIFANAGDDAVSIGTATYGNAMFKVDAYGTDGHTYGSRQTFFLNPEPGASKVGTLSELFVNSYIGDSNRSHSAHWSQVDVNQNFNTGGVSTSIAGNWARHDWDAPIVASGGGAITLYGYLHETYLQDAASGAVSNITSYQANPTAYFHPSAAIDITTVRGVQVFNASAGLGHVSNSYGLDISKLYADGTVYGIWIADQDQASNNFALVTNAGDVIFNQGGDANTNFRVEGDTDENLIYTSPGDNRVGIGTNSPDGKLHVSYGNSNVTPNGNYDELFVEDNSTAGITIGTIAAGAGGLFIGETGTATRHGFVGYMSANATYPDEVHWWVANGLRQVWTNNEVEFQQAQTISTSTGNLTLAPSGHVITKLPFGHMYIHDGNLTVSIGSQNEWTKVPSGWSEGNTSAVDFINTRELEVTIGGFYKIDWNMSFQMDAGTNQQVEGTIGINGVAESGASAHRTIGTATDIGSFGGTSIISLSANDDISLMVQNESTANDVVVEHANITIMRIG